MQSVQSVQRRFGRAQSADESQVSVLLKDFDEADKMLLTLIEAARAWRDSWSDILSYQQNLIAEFHSMYLPVKGAATDHPANHEPATTPESTLGRVSRLQAQYTELKEDMLQEVKQVDDRIIIPATDARNYMHPMKKVMKKRHDRKLDYEKYQSRYDSSAKKHGRSEKENAALAKHNSDLERAKEEYEAADEKLRESLPPLLNTVFSLLPHMLAAQIMIQNNLLGHCYTQLHNYSQEESFPSPSPAMAKIVANWETDFFPVQKEMESGYACLAKGKTVRAPMKQDVLTLQNDTGHRRMSNPDSSSLRPSISPARSDTSSHSKQSLPPSPNMETRPKILSVPSSGSLALSTPSHFSSGAPPSTGLLGVPSSHAPAGPRADYFTRDRVPSNPSDLAAAVAMKKKPPPPPPKRIASDQGFWVTALYDFAGQGHGDLSFREGDRIKVLKKTDSTQDWWEGELKGVRGSFPANYCQA